VCRFQWRGMLGPQCDLKPQRETCPIGATDRDVSKRTPWEGEPLCRQPRGCGTARTILSVVALVTSSMFLTGCGRSVASPTCTLKELMATAGKGYRELPPTHDNDAGRGRIPDTHPDADLDANQRAALCDVYKSETHLPG
jgi:hypothetical protein